MITDKDSSLGTMILEFVVNRLEQAKVCNMLNSMPKKHPIYLCMNGSTPGDNSCDAIGCHGYIS